MKTYSLSKNNFLQFRRRLIIRTGIFDIVAMAIILVVAVYKAENTWPYVQPSIAWLYVLLSIPIFLAVFGFTLYRSIKQSHAIWDSVRVEIGEDYVARRQLRVPEVRINRTEVTALREINNGLCVLTSDKFRALCIPIELDGPDYEEIKTTLSAWAPIQPKSATARIWFTAQLILLGIGTLIVFFSTSAWLVLIVGVILSGYYIYFFLQLLRHKAVDSKSIFVYIFFICLLLLATGLRSYYFFIGY